MMAFLRYGLILGIFYILPAILMIGQSITGFIAFAMSVIFVFKTFLSFFQQLYPIPIFW